MKAILINAKEQQIIEVEIDKKDQLNSVYKALGVEMIEEAFMNLPSNDALYVDEEGLYKNYGYGFNVKGRSLLVGNGIIIGIKGSKWADTNMTVDAIKNEIRFASL